MKRLLLVLILTFSFQTWTKADDIKDFEIEGFSLGQSLLEHFDKKKIDKEINAKYAINYDDQFIQIATGFGNDFPLSKKIKNYDEVTLVLKTNDIDYIIYSVSGKIFCANTDECFLKKKQIITDLQNFFGEKVTIDSYKNKHGADKTGVSLTHDTEFIFENSKQRLVVSYYQWSKKLKLSDNVKVIIHDKVFDDFLQSYY